MKVNLDDIEISINRNVDQGSFDRTFQELQLRLLLAIAERLEEIGKGEKHGATF